MMLHHSSLTLVVNSLGHGGGEKQAALIGSGLAQRGWDVQVVSLLARDDYLDPVLRPRTVVVGKRGRMDLSRVIRTLRREIRPDVPVLCFNWYPHFLTAHALPASVRIARYGNAPSDDGVLGLRRYFARQAQRTATAVVGCSYGVVREAVRELGSPRLLCAAIPNAALFRSSTLGAPSPWAKPYLLSAGRLHPQKDHTTLLAAFKLAAPAVPHDLVIAGDGPDEPEVRRLVEGDEVLRNRVHFVGYQIDFEPWMRNADLLVHTSRWEGFGNVIIEAMSVGTPVVVTDAPWGPRDILERVPAGRLVPVGDPEAISSAVLELLGNEQERVRLGEIGREGVSRHFSHAAALDAYEHLIGAVVTGSGGCAHG